MSVKDDVKTGVILVRTETSSYRIDYDRSIVVRNPSPEAPVDNDEVYVANLRKDDEEIPLIRATEPVIGKSMTLYLDIREGYVTQRVTTYVQEVTVL